jgi:molecular chaperone Hsp33
VTGSRESDNTDRIGEATVRRTIDRSHDLIVARADFALLFAAYLDHVRRWEQRSDDLGQTMIRQGLGAAALHLSCRPRGETVGWTINIRSPATHIFITGDTDQSTVAGRISTGAVKTSAQSQMVVQVSRPGRQLAQSTIPVTGLDLLVMFEQFYDLSEQTPARFFEITDSEYVMLFGLPEVDAGWLHDLSRDEAVALAARDLSILDERTYRFQCGCRPELVIDVVLRPFWQEPEELFRGDSEVEILCPRCGRRWWVKRADFDEALRARQGKRPAAGEHEAEEGDRDPGSQ